jgi:hypothetical protein
MLWGRENASGILWFMGRVVISALGKIFWGWVIVFGKND